MTMSLLWYVLAGALLGFAASTLWEWLYFRRKRLNWESERVQELQQQLADEQAWNEQMRLARESSLAEGVPPTPGNPEDAAVYASPGVFLESEAVGIDDDAGRNVEDGVEEYAAANEGAEAHVAAVAGERSASNSRPPNTASERGASARSTAADRPVAGPALANAKRSGHAIDGGDVAAGAITAPEPDEISDHALSIDGFEDDATILERLAAELAQAPDDHEYDEASDTGRDDEAEASPQPVFTARSTDHPDNLSKIKGIGDVYKFRLYTAGIFTWHQVAESDIETLRVATNAYPGSNVHEWPRQARELAEKHGRQGAFYTGPVPDDLTQIIGIGPVSERTLYRAGICTYAQLAGATAGELQELFPIAIAGDEPDFGQWIRLAIELANRNR